MNQHNEKIISYPLSAGDIVNLSIDGYKKAFFFNLFPYLLGAVFLFFISPLISNLIIPEGITISTDPNSDLTQGYTYILTSLFVLSTLQGAIMSIPIAISVLVTHKIVNYKPIIVNEILSELMPKAFTIFVIGGLVSFLSLLGLLAFGIGLFITITLFSVWYAVVIVVILFDDPSFGSLSKAKLLTRNNFLSTFGQLIVIGIVQFLITMALQLGVDFIIADSTSVIYDFASSVVESIAMPLTGISIFYIYLNLHWHQEHPDYRYRYPQGAQNVPIYQNQSRNFDQGISQYKVPSSFQSSSSSPSPPLNQPTNSQKAPKYCSSCGAAALNEGDLFCNSCGTKFDTIK